MDRPRRRVFCSAEFQTAIGADTRFYFSGWAKKLCAGLEHAVFNQRAKRHTLLLFRALCHLQGRIIQHGFGGNALAGGGGVFRFGLNADKMPPQTLRHRAGCAGAEKRIQHHITGITGGQQNAVQQSFGFLRRMQFVTRFTLQTFAAIAYRQHPVGAHLQIIIQGFHCAVIKGVARRVFIARRPDKRLMRVGKARAFKIRHRVGFAPDNVIQHPKTDILQGRADAENIVIRANDPQRPRRLHHTARLSQPRTGESIISGKAVKLIPVIRHRIHMACVRSGQIALKLEIIGRVSENEVNTRARQTRQRFKAITFNNGVYGQGLGLFFGHDRTMSHPRVAVNR